MHFFIYNVANARINAEHVEAAGVAMFASSVEGLAELVGAAGLGRAGASEHVGVVQETVSRIPQQAYCKWGKYPEFPRIKYPVKCQIPRISPYIYAHRNVFLVFLKHCFSCSKLTITYIYAIITFHATDRHDRRRRLTR